jgi:hypothetical protein
MVHLPGTSSDVLIMVGSIWFPIVAMAAPDWQTIGVAHEDIARPELLQSRLWLRQAGRWLVISTQRYIARIEQDGEKQSQPADGNGKQEGEVDGEDGDGSAHTTGPLEISWRVDEVLDGERTKHDVRRIRRA